MTEEDWSLSHTKVAAGQYHSAFIGYSEVEYSHASKALNRLFVWGNNEEGQLSNYIQPAKGKGTGGFVKKIERPEKVLLMFGQQEYEAVSVSSGPSYNIIIGKINLEHEKQMLQGRKKSRQKLQFKEPLIMPADEERFKDYRAETRDQVEAFRVQLRKILLRKGTLSSLFQTNDEVDANGFSGADRKRDQDIKQRQLVKREGGYSQFYKESGMPGAFKPQGRNERNAGEDDVNPATFHIERSEFIEQLQEREIATIDEIHNVAEVIYENNNEVSLEQLEDFALGFQQEAVKLFMYGKCDAKLFSFNKKLPIVNPKTGKKARNGGAFDLNTSSESSEEDADDVQIKMSIITRPTVITFPRFTAPIVQVSCGVAHILALTGHSEMFSWGNGDYGALGFGSIQSVLQPTPLHIKQNGVKLQISRVECGSLHSMCITKKRQMFTWGTGKQGRLGLSNEEDTLVPTEIVQLSNMRVVQISAGESHSGAITQSGKVYIWGNGSYGRLGTGFEQSENSPVQIDDLSREEIVRISCGAFHTFVLSKEGKLFAFGQNKYGKLGMNVRKENTAFRSTNIEILPFNITYGDNPGKRKMTIKPSTVTFLQIVAGYNHSMAITSDKRVYTWGYPGFGILGREGVDNIPVAIECGLRDNLKCLYNVRLSPNVLQLPSDDRGGAVANNQSQVSLSTKIEQVACVALGTLVLTDEGKIFYVGDTRYGQLPIEDDNQEIKGHDDNMLFKQISLPHKVTKIACGGDHIFIITEHDKVFGWGRNASAQLGIGFQQDHIDVPTEVPAFNDKVVTKIVCGPNYSAAITTGGRLMVCGSMENGKLGLGSNMRNGFAQEFTQVPRLRSVIDATCGPNHMIAIVAPNSTSGFGVFTWGNNSMGQLGIDTTENSYSPKEITTLKKSERFDQVVAGFDFSLGVSRTSRRIYLWGNIKYNGSLTNSTVSMQKTPIQIKELEGQKIKQVFCSQTYVYVITENDTVKHWGQWLYDRAKEEMSLAGLTKQDEEDKKGIRKSEGEAVVSQGSSRTGSSDSDDDDSAYYRSEESEEGDNGDANNKAAAAKRRKEQASQYFKIESFPEDGDHAAWPPQTIAFGTEHAAAIGKDGLLYTWGQNQVQQLGVSLLKYQEGADDTANREKLQSHIQDASINIVLQANKIRRQEEAYGGQEAGQDAENEQDGENGDDQQDADALDGDDQDAATPGTGGNDDADQEGAGDSDDGGDDQQVTDAATGKKKGVTFAQEGGKDGVSHDATGDKSSAMKEQTTAGGAEATSETKSIMIDTKAKKIKEFPQVTATKPIRIGGADNHFEKKQYDLAEHLRNEKKNKKDEDSLFQLDKYISDSLNLLLTRCAKLPEIERQRRSLRVMIKNSFMQRVTEKPLNVPPAIDWNSMQATNFKERKARSMFKPHLQQILNILHVHPCFMLNMYKSQQFTNTQLLKYLKNLFPTQVFPNKQISAFSPNLDSGVLVSREQERINLNLVSLLRHVIHTEISAYKEIKKVNFLSESSLIGKIFYRILKSQERNVDTVCSILAHMMNKFISRLQEGSEFDGGGGKQDQARAGKKAVVAVAFEHTAKATNMYGEFIDTLIADILQSNVLTTSNAIFTLKRVWLNISDDKNKSPVVSMRFSSEIGLMIEIIQQELNLLKPETQSNKQAKVGESHEDWAALKIFGLIFSKMLNKITSSTETLMLYLYPYLRESKKQIVIEEAMTKQGNTFMQLIKVIIHFFSDHASDTIEQNDSHWEELKQRIKKNRADFLQEILLKFKETNYMLPKLLPVKHFENVLFHSLSPYDFQLRLDKSALVELFKGMMEHREEIALTKPVENDQLFKLFGSADKSKDDDGGGKKTELPYKNSDFMKSLNSYPDKFVIKIPSRQFVYSSSTALQKCKVCLSVLTDDYHKAEGQPIIDQYEPEDKESFISVYNDILRKLTQEQFSPDKNPMFQLEDVRKSNRSGHNAEWLEEKIKEFEGAIMREVESMKDDLKDQITRKYRKMDESEAIEKEFNEVVSLKVKDRTNFNLMIANKEGEGKSDAERQLEGIAYIHIFEELILKNTLEKLNTRLSHKQIGSVLQTRLNPQLMNYTKQMLENIEKNEMFQLKLQLFNTQLGLGNSELRKLTKNSDQVTQMKGIQNQQRNQKYSQILYRVLPDRQKMSLRAIVTKDVRQLINDGTITEIRVKTLRPMIDQCKLLIMEDEKRDVIIKLLYIQTTKSCLCFGGKAVENLLLQFLLCQQDIVQIRKQVQKYKVFEMHVNLAYEQNNAELQKKVINFAEQMSGNTDNKSDKKKKGGDKKAKVKTTANTRESALSLIEKYNRRLYKDAIEFNLDKLLGLINDMLRTRYAYIFNSDRTPEELIKDNIGNI